MLYFVLFCLYYIFVATSTVYLAVLLHIVSESVSVHDTDVFCIFLDICPKAVYSS